MTTSTFRDYAAELPEGGRFVVDTGTDVEAIIECGHGGDSASVGLGRRPCAPRPPGS